MKTILSVIVTCLLVGMLSSCGELVYDPYPYVVYTPSYVKPLPPPPPPRKPLPPPPPKKYYNHHYQHRR